MGTRLRYEKMIRDSFPAIRWLRVYSPGNFTAYVYACDEMLRLPDELIGSLNAFLREMGAAHLEHVVKHYFCLKDDHVPSSDWLPPAIAELALACELNAAGVKKSIACAFPFLDPTYLKVESDKAFFKISPGRNLTEEELFIFDRFLPEILPLGIQVKLEN